jgi:hypothetical protein
MDWKVEAAAGPYTLKSMDEREYSDGDTTLTYTTELYFKDERIYKKSSATHNGMGGAFGSHHSVKLEEKAGRFTLRVIENRVEESGAATNGEAHLDGQTEAAEIWLLDAGKMVMEKAQYNRDLGQPSTVNADAL